MAVLGIAAVLNVVRLIQGPDMPDRVLALDTLYINALALIVLFGIWLASDLFFEAALLIAVMGFVSQYRGSRQAYAARRHHRLRRRYAILD